MADQTIRGLTSSTNFPRNSVVPVAPTSGADVKTTGQQIVDMVQTTSVSTHNTTASLTGAEIVGGIVRSTPVADGVTLTLPSASSIYTAMGSTPPIGTYVECIFENLSDFPITLAKIDANLLTTGLVTTILNSHQSFKLRFSVTALGPTQITVDGGTNSSIGNFSDLTATGPINFPNYTPSQKYIASSGSDTYNGQIISPYLSLTYADANALDGSCVFISCGPHNETNINKKPLVSWQGSGKENTFLNLSGTFGIDNTAWSALLEPPAFDINNITISASIVNLNPSSYVTNSSIIFNNTSIITPATFGNVTNLYFDNFYLNTPAILNTENISLLNGKLDGVIIFESTTSDVSTINVIIRNVKFNDEIQFLTGFSLGNANYNIEIYNSPGITDIICDDNNIEATFNITIDANSMPSTGISPSGNPIINITYATNVSTGINTDNGFALGREFSWNDSSKTLVAGEGAHITGGTNNILLGKHATSNYDGSFVASDSTATPSGNHYPSADNQAIFHFAGGFGIGTNNSGGVEGPQSGFHYAHNYGNDGKFLFSAAGIIADGNMHNEEVNPYISSNDLIFKIKNSSGSVFSYNLSSLAGYVLTTGNQSISGTKEFEDPTILFEVQNPLIYNRVPTFLTANSGTILAAHLVGGIIVFTPTANATWTFPSAADIESIIGSVSINRGLEILLINDSSFSVTFSVGTNVNFNGLTTSGSLFLSPFSSVKITLVKVGSTPEYTVAGPSYGSLSFNEESYSHTTTWSGIWASPLSGNCVINRLGNQVTIKIPTIVDTSNAAATITMDTILPTRFRPSTDVWIVHNCQTNTSNWTNALMQVQSSGAITVYATGSRGNFTSGVSSGIMSGSIVYMI